MTAAFFATFSSTVQTQALFDASLESTLQRACTLNSDTCSLKAVLQQAFAQYVILPCSEP